MTSLLVWAAQAASGADKVGMVVGGWEYVYAAYIVVLGGISIYGISLMLRLKQARNLVSKLKAKTSNKTP